MIRLTLASALLIASTVATHVFGISRMLIRLREQAPPSDARGIAWLLIRVAWMLIVCHIAEIAIWALFYLLVGCLPDVESAVYFSGATYTTVGYGDLVLPVKWRVLAPVEGLTGILMCGLSASIFFAMNEKIYGLSLKERLLVMPPAPDRTRGQQPALDKRGKQV